MAFTLGSILSGAGKLLGGVIKSTPVGGAITALGDLVKSGSPAGKLVAKPITALPGVPDWAKQQPVSTTGGGVMKGAPALPPLVNGVPQLPGTSVVRSPFGDVVGGTSSRGVTPGAGARGYGHYTATGRFVRTYASGKAIRRQNPMNVSAARRAVRRLKAGDKLFRKIFRILHHSKASTVPKGRKR